MQKQESNFHFRFMTLGYKFRDFFRSRMDILKEAGIKPGFHVLDYGCGPGSYLIPLSEMVGGTGRIYAADIHPLAIRYVERLAKKRGLTNIQTIHTDCATGLEAGVINVVLLYDTYHTLSTPVSVLAELHRVLKPSGVLSFSDHHMKSDEIRTAMTRSGLFTMSSQGKRAYLFSKV